MSGATISSWSRDHSDHTIYRMRHSTHAQWSTRRRFSAGMGGVSNAYLASQWGVMSLDNPSLYLLLIVFHGAFFAFIKTTPPKNPEPPVKLLQMFVSSFKKFLQVHQVPPAPGNYTRMHAPITKEDAAGAHRLVTLTVEETHTGPHGVAFPRGGEGCQTHISRRSGALCR